VREGGENPQIDNGNDGPSAVHPRRVAGNERRTGTMDHPRSTHDVSPEMSDAIHAKRQNAPATKITISSGLIKKSGWLLFLLLFLFRILGSPSE